MSSPVPVTGLWLRKASRSGAEVEVLVEFDGAWHKVLVEGTDGPISHIVEPAGIRDSPLDDLPDAPSPAEQEHAVRR